MSTTANKSFLQRLDYLTLLFYFLLVTIGMVAVFSVEYRSTDTSFFIMSKSHMKQLMWLGISLFFAIIILMTESKFFSSFAFLSYAIGLFLLIITIFLGKNIKGSHSWLGVGGFAFQPGEVCKIFTSLALAKFLSLPETNFQLVKHRVVGIALALVPCFFIILQSETGLALVYFAFFLAMYREGLPHAFLIVGFSVVALGLATLLIDRTVLLFIILGISIIFAFLFRQQLQRQGSARIIFISSLVFCIGFSQFVVPFVFKNLFKDYQIERIYSMLGTEVPQDFISTEGKSEQEKKKDYDYNVRQSKIAIGSGGLWGKGFLNGTSTKNDFVPEQNTDFIFCSIGEQFGFVGSALLIVLYIALMLRIVFIAERQRSTFSRVYAYCVASILFFHFAINISMTIGLAPVIGITLPFLSYGGSSLLSFSILIFTLIRLDADRAAMIR